MSIQSDKIMTLADGAELYNDLRARSDEKASVIIGTKTGNPVVLKDAIPGMPLNKLNVSFSPKQSGTGDPSPSNVRNISGWTGLNIWKTGKNLLEINDDHKVSYSSMYNHWTSSNNVISIEGNSTGGYIMPCTPNTTYTYSFESEYIGENLAVRVYAYADYPTAVPGSALIYNELSSTARGIPPATFTTSATARWLVVGFYAHDQSSYAIQKMQVELGSIATEYEPYSGDTYSFTFPDGQTIYGGTIDIKTGVLSVEWARADMGSATWTVQNNGDAYWFMSSQFMTGAKRISSNSYPGDIMCDRFKNVAAATIYSGAADDNTIAIEALNSVNARLRVKATSYNNDASAFKSAMDGVYVYYVLTTPTVIQLDANIVNTLVGTMVLYSDIDSVDIDYKIDTKSYVDIGARDVQIDGVSILSGGVANIPHATSSTLGLVKPVAGLYVDPNTGNVSISAATDAQIKAGDVQYFPIAPYREHTAAFYGIAKAAGDTTQKSSANAVGVYTPQAKAAIQTMFGVENGVTFVETVSGTSATISGVPNVKYECGELTALTLTAPAHGTIDVWFMTGNTPTMVTTTGVVFPAWFDLTDLDPNMVYEFVITDGYGGVTEWERPVSV